MQDDFMKKLFDQILRELSDEQKLVLERRISDRILRELSDEQRATIGKMSERAGVNPFFS